MRACVANPERCHKVVQISSTNSTQDDNLINEAKEFKFKGWAYWSEGYNYIDLSGQFFVIVSSVLRYFMPPEEFYEEETFRTFLIGAVLLIGLRAFTSLMLFENYRVQI